MPTHAQLINSLLALDKEFANLNMPLMSVTLDVSRLSGWLNASAYCRVGKEEGIGSERAGLEVRA